MIKTHRCIGSVTEKTSIRYGKIFEQYDFEWDKPSWYLFKWYKDYEWNTWMKGEQILIKYCPFCGEKLEEVVNNDKLG